MLHRTLPLLLLAWLGWPTDASALGDETDGFALGLEFGGHFGAGPESLSRTGPELSFGSLGPPIDELALSIGSTVESLRSELALRVGYGFARGSVDSTPERVRYRVTRIPLALAWRAALLDGRVHPLLGADVGVLWTSVRYAGGFDGNAEAALGFSARALAGLGFDVGRHGQLRLFLQYRLDPDRNVVGGPNLRGAHWAFGAGYVFTLGRSEAKPAPPRGAPLASEGRKSGLDAAFEWIRRGDARSRSGDASAAADAYREGVTRLPGDPETRMNVELPVRIDWANQLREAGRRADAIDVLREAWTIRPGDPALLRAFNALGAPLPARRDSAPQREEPRPLEPSSSGD